MKKILSSLFLAASLCSAAPTILADMVNINEATAAVLKEHLKGIGDKKAEAIVAYRQEHGDFKTLDEIKEVKGIGDGIFKKIRDDLSLNEGVTGSVGKAGAEGKADDVVNQPGTPVEKSAPMLQKKQADKGDES